MLTAKYTANIKSIIILLITSRLQSHDSSCTVFGVATSPWPVLTLPLWTIHRADSRFAPSQWETALLCNDVSHWLGTNLEPVQMHAVSATDLNPSQPQDYYKDRWWVYQWPVSPDDVLCLGLTSSWYHGVFLAIRIRGETLSFYSKLSVLSKILGWYSTLQFGNKAIFSGGLTLRVFRILSVGVEAVGSTYIFLGDFIPLVWSGKNRPTTKPHTICHFLKEFP